MIPEWENARILRLWMDLLEELRVASDRETGRVLWIVFSNNEAVVDPNGMLVDTGSWRYCGGLIAALCGGDYMDYYCAWARDYNEGLIERIREALRARGFSLMDWNTWERGVLDGTYPTPSRWVDYFDRVRRGEIRRAGSVL